MSSHDHIRPVKQFRLQLVNKENGKVQLVSIGGRTLNEAIKNATDLFPRWKVKE